MTVLHVLSGDVHFKSIYVTAVKAFTYMGYSFGGCDLV